MVRHVARKRWIFSVLLVLVGCASPAERLDDQAREQGFERILVQGNGFRHVTYRSGAWPPRGTLHVYLGGDGRPWIRRYWVSPDPTPGHSLVLELMTSDPASGLFLGRPCYHGLAAEDQCDERLWTSDRYSKTVIDSMEAALRRITGAHEPLGLVFLGHSGGGTLAMLLAARFAQTRAVLTIAGNLDTRAWARYHGYSPLKGSLNPAEQAPLGAGVNQLHLAGGRDENVPPRLIELALRRQPNAQFKVLEDFDHKCCWLQVWPEYLNRISASH